MMSTKEVMTIERVDTGGAISILYTPRTDRTIYDLCDLNGRIVKTGLITGEKTEVDISDLRTRALVLLIVDGDQVFSQRCNF